MLRPKEIKGNNFKNQVRRIREYVERDTDHTPAYYCRNLGLDDKEWDLFLHLRWKPSLQQAILMFKWFRNRKPALLLSRTRFIVNSYWREYRFDLADKL